MILYRPVGLQELELIYDSGMKVFPARLPQQPIFYPVFNLEYARQTASDWNAKSGQFAGYITEFKVEDHYISAFEKHTVGSSEHQEFWIPAEEMEKFNQHIIGHIKVVEAHFGDSFQGFVPETFGLQGKNAIEQFTLLANSYVYKRMDFYLEIKRNHKAIFLNYPYWQTYEFKNQGLKAKVLQAIKEAWLTSFPKIPLPLPPPAYEDTQLVKQPQAQPLVEPVREDITLVEQTDSDSWFDPVQEDITPVELADTDSLVEPVQETTPLVVKQTHAHSLVNPIDEDIAPVEQTDSHFSVNPVHEDVTPVKQTDSDSLDAIDEDIPPVEQTDSEFLVNPVHEDITPVKQTDAHAHTLINRVQKNNPPVEQIDSHFAQGIKLGLSGEYREAIKELSQAVEEDHEHVVAHTSLGVAFHRWGEDDRALACYETAVKIDPKYAEAHYFRANILYGHGNVREAIAGYTIAIGLEPELIETHQKPIPQDRLTDYSPAPAEMYWIAKPAHRILHLNKLLETHPGQAHMQADVFKERGTEYYRLWNYEQAIADYGSSLALQPEDASAFHFRGLAYEQLRQWDRALEDYQKAVAINPLLSDVYINRGVTFGKTGNFRQSIASLTEGIRLAPENPDGYFNRGTSFFQLGDLAKAIDDFSNVIRLSPRDEAAYYWRGISNEEAGRQREAIADYRQFLVLSQDENARAEIEQKLRAWREWNAGARNGPDAARQGRYVGDRRAVPNDRQKTNQVPSEKPDQEFDLYGLIAALGERALNSTWFGSGVDCYGEKAEDLYAFTDQNRPIEGHEFLRIAAGIRQTIEGDFQAFDPGATSHWIFIRAWDGSGFYIETNDPQIEKQLKDHFQAVEEVEGAYPPYEGLFIRI